MKQIEIKVSELQQGDKVVRDSDGEILTVAKITDKGFQQNSVFIDYKEGGWTSIPKNATVTKVLTHLNQ